MKYLTIKHVPVLLLACLGTQLWAHPGHVLLTGQSGAFWSGLVHPVSGADHLLLATGLGLLLLKSRQLAAGLLAGRGMVATQLAFYACIFMLMLVSGFLLAPVVAITESTVEWGIRLSLVALSAGLLFKRTRTALALCFGLLFFHGMAHGLEKPAQLSALPYLAGLVASMTTLLASGYTLGRLLLKQLSDTGRQRVYRVAALATVTGLV